MAVFFGKFSGHFPEQIEHGYYETDRTEMFDTLEVGDHVFAIGNGIIQLWKAKEWSFNGTFKRMTFDKINTNLGIGTNQLISIKAFQLTKTLIIYTVRQGQKAFYSIQLVNPEQLNELLNLEFYSNHSNYRTISIVVSEAEIDKMNINLLSKDGVLSVIRPDHCDNDVFMNFNDNASFIGKGQIQKDKTLKVIQTSNKPISFDPNQLSIRRVYDAYCCPYQVKKDTLKDFNLGNHAIYKVSIGPDEINDGDFEYFVNEQLIIVHGDTPPKGRSSHSQGANFNSSMQIGDYFYLTRGNKSVVLFGRITSISEPCTRSNLGQRGWQQREFELIEEPIVEAKYSGENKWWAPNNNSTFIKIPRSDIQTANRELFHPFFNLNIAFQNMNPENENNSSDPRFDSLNQILYGPPGTGKTYSTIDQVVSICEPSEYRKDDHEANKRVYDRLVKEGQVVFTTFHQSMAYEDFVEGIKPSSTDTGKIAYDVVNGIFKETCDKAKGVAGSKHTESNFDFNNTTYWKMSLGGKNRTDVSDWCIENNFIALGWGGDNDCTPLQGITKWESFRDKFIELFPEKVDESAFNIQAMYAFQNWMKKGDVVVISKGNKIVEAVGVIEEEYQFIPEPPFPYHHTRKVRWLATNMNAAPSLFLDINISQQTIYRFNSDDVKTEEFKKNFGTYTVESNQTQNYVLIIDEINRGNVSAIFGELITLIEEDKRLGAENELTVTLPYSKEKFSVPSNLHIIGTMNTADRSVEALDTALRRRFSFVEMLPDPKALRNKGTHGDGMIEDINLEELLTKLNDRIEVLVDRDHTIGHAFFINDKSMDDLKHTFKNKIIPLLQEYFYGNYQKMALVLGNSFFSIKEQKSVKFAEEAKDYDFSDQVYTIRDCTDNDFNFLNAIRKLINKPVKEDTEQPKEVNQEPESEVIEQDNG